MSDDWKYVVFDGDTMFIFPPGIPHDLMRALEGQWAVGSVLGKITSAGFVRLPSEPGEKVCCHGQSTTLKLRPADNDWKLATKLLSQS